MPRDSDILPHLRRELKERWPAVRFSVRRGRGTGSGWGRIEYTDGPSRSLVDQVAYKYQSQRFDGMDDGYHSTNNELPEGCTGMSGIHVNRNHSPEFEARLVAAAVAKYPELSPLIESGRDWQNSLGEWVGSKHAICRTLAENRHDDLGKFLPGPMLKLA